MSKWLLPENLADILPAEARRIEELRRELLDLYRSHGFELVAPPLVEYLDSLLSGSGSDLNLRTCKLVDQLSGRTLGVRADITPQVSRIDAHLLNRAGVTRLCYCGTVLHARPADLLSDRELLQIGAEVFGHEGVEADIQVIQMALESVQRAGVPRPRLDLGHPGIFRAIVSSDSALAEIEAELSECVAAKDQSGIQALCTQVGPVRADLVQALLTLPGLYGGISVLDRALSSLPSLPAIQKAVRDMQTLIQALPDYDFSVDLADIGAGYAYHTGVVFAVYAQGWSNALVRGGRYDGAGKAFGRTRPATGFSLDLRKLSSGLAPSPLANAIQAPWGTDALLVQTIRNLREAGEIVVQVLPGQSHALDEFIIDRELVLRNGQWQVESVA